MVRTAIHTQPNLLLANRAFYMPIYSFIDDIQPHSMRHEGLENHYLLSNCRVPVKLGFTDNLETYTRSRPEAQGVTIYMDDIIRPKTTETFQHVDLIVTQNVLQNLEIPDLSEVLKRIQSFSKQSLHYITFKQWSIKNQSKNVRDKEYWLSLQPAKYAVSPDSYIIFLLNH